MAQQDVFQDIKERYILSRKRAVFFTSGYNFLAKEEALNSVSQHLNCLIEYCDIKGDTDRKNRLLSEGEAFIKGCQSFRSSLPLPVLYAHCCNGILEVVTNVKCGTAFIVSKQEGEEEGFWKIFALTNWHVVDGGISCRVRFNSIIDFEGTIGYSEYIDADIEDSKEKLDLAIISFQIPKNPLGIGYPFGRFLPAPLLFRDKRIFPSMEVCALGDRLHGGMGAFSGKIERADDSFVTFDAKVAQGCSGGALVDSYANVVGIVTHKKPVATGTMVKQKAFIDGKQVMLETEEVMYIKRAVSVATIIEYLKECNVGYTLQKDEFYDRVLPI